MWFTSNSRFVPIGKLEEQPASRIPASGKVERTGSARWTTTTPLASRLDGKFYA